MKLVAIELRSSFRLRSKLT